MMVPELRLHDIMLESMAAGRQAWHWSSSGELISLSTGTRQRELTGRGINF